MISSSIHSPVGDAGRVLTAVPPSAPAFLVRFFVRGLMHTERYKDGIGAQCRVDDLHDCGVHAYAICDR